MQRTHYPPSVSVMYNTTTGNHDYNAFVTNVMTVTADSLPLSTISSQPDAVNTTLHALYMVISGIGLCFNGFTIYVILRSKSIRKSVVYVLLVNQSAIDFTICVVTVLYVFTDSYLEVKADHGFVKWFYCFFIYSTFLIGCGTMISSYNLAAISVERCYSIVSPLSHRQHCTARTLVVVALLVWTAMFLIQLGYALPTLGIRPDGGCYFWDNFPSEAAKRVFAVGGLFGFNLVPLTMMLVSYLMIYMSVTRKQEVKDVAGSVTSNKKVKDTLKMNVVKMLATCVLVYILCHVFRSTINIVTRFDNYQMRSYLYMIG